MNKFIFERLSLILGVANKKIIFYIIFQLFNLKLLLLGHFFKYENIFCKKKCNVQLLMSRKKHRIRLNIFDPKIDLFNPTGFLTVPYCLIKRGWKKT